ncbi:MAG: hypothetical protein JWM19_6487 [Actinomycetia bacterium]|nr:hypothetical protein [Actinomycetes bacterium]
MAGAGDEQNRRQYFPVIRPAPTTALRSVHHREGHYLAEQLP